MQTDLTKVIVAVVVLESARGRVESGGLGPIIYAQSVEEQQKIAMYLSRIMEAVAHDLENGVLILVKH